MHPATTALSILFLASAASAANIRFDPPNPTSRTPIIAHVVGNYSSCTPTAQRNGSIISITLENCSISPPPPAVDLPVDLGVLPAGVYEVVVGLPSILIGLADATLVVQDAAPPFQILPNVAALAGGQITITGHDLIFCTAGITPPVCTNAVVKFGDAATTVISATPDQIVVRAPQHDPGAVDVTIDRNGNVLRSTAAFEYLSDSQPPDPAFYETVLFPVVFSGPGAFGSQWTTDLVLRNENDVPLILPRASTFAQPQAHSTTRISGHTIANGTVEFLPRQAARAVSFDVLVRDLSRQAEALGTEIPVVREKDFFDRLLELLNVPTDPRFRVALRVYDLGAPAAINVVIHPLDSDEVLLSTFVFPTGTMPAYAQISDLVAAYPQLAGKGPLRITVDAPVPGNPTLWAFVSVTNNETQHVTTISPQ